MYGSILEAAVRDQQNDRAARAGAARRAAALTDGGTPSTSVRSRGRRGAHPVQSFYRWLAAGQL